MEAGALHGLSTTASDGSSRAASVSSGSTWSSSRPGVKEKSPVEKSLPPSGWRSTESPIPCPGWKMSRITRERTSSGNVSSNTAEDPVIDAPTPKNCW